MRQKMNGLATESIGDVGEDVGLSTEQANGLFLEDLMKVIFKFAMLYDVWFLIFTMQFFSIFLALLFYIFYYYSN